MVFIIKSTYFGVMNSHIFNGLTIVKKILKIKVVDALNSTISLPKSLLRYSFLAIPFSLNGAQIANEAVLSYLMYPLSIIVFGGLFSISYLYVFNRKTRQSLHDLAVGSFVVNENSNSQELPSVWKPHLAIIIVIFMISAALPVLTTTLSRSAPFKGLLATQEAVTNNEFVKYAGITEGSSTFTSSDTGSTTTTYIHAQASLYKNDVGSTMIAKQLAKTVVNSYPESVKKDLIQVTLKYGYDIGISSKWNSHSHRFDPKQIKGSE
jgi:uncharacterized RDD family membrane protein YckC